MGEKGKQDRVPVTVALVVMITGSLLSLWMAWLTGVGLLFSTVGFGYSLLFGALWWRGKGWAKEWLLGRYVVTLAFAGFLLFRYGDVVGAMFESLVALCMIWLLLGYAGRVRAYAGAVAYAAVLVMMGGLLWHLAHRPNPAMRIVNEVPHRETWESSHHYTVAFGEMPWRALTQQQAAKVLGTRAGDADLQMVRADGTAYALFFPLQFRNVELNDQLAMMLEMEIREKWLTQLSGWESFPVDDGFFLTAAGEVNQTPVAYVVYYKHFGNMGVYAVFWTAADNRQQLIEEARAFYQGTTAPPVKERMALLTPAEVYQTNSGAVVQVNVYDEEGNLTGRGTGFNIASEGLVVTNLHVLLAGRQLEVVFPGEEPSREVQIVGISAPATDLALLVVPGKERPAVEGFRSVPVAPGDPVVVIGNPKGLVNSLSEGIIGGIREEEGVTLYQITAAISSGSSGGPVFNAFGEVIGVANSIMVDAQSLNFSISIDELGSLYLLENPISLDYLIDRMQPK
jgi:Trypsin-like peptidase domain